MADSIWVEPAVTGAEVDTTRTCGDCAALMVRLSIVGVHDDGTVDLPPILLCPDCFDVQQVVAEWREQVRKGRGG